MTEAMEVDEVAAPPTSQRSPVRLLWMLMAAAMVVGALQLGAFPRSGVSSVDELTQASSADAATRALREGDRGEAVKMAQRNLNGFCACKLAVDGHFGAKTKAAVRWFQDATGLTVDGKIGTNTWAKLNLGRFADHAHKVTPGSSTKKPKTTKKPACHGWECSAEKQKKVCEETSFTVKTKSSKFFTSSKITGTVRGCYSQKYAYGVDAGRVNASFDPTLSYWKGGTPTRTIVDGRGQVQWRVKWPTKVCGGVYIELACVTSGSVTLLVTLKAGGKWTFVAASSGLNGFGHSSTVGPTSVRQVR